MLHLHRARGRVVYSFANIHKRTLQQFMRIELVKLQQFGIHYSSFSVPIAALSHG